MNALIGQLAEQAGLLGPSSRVGDAHAATERFAQLIVAECIDVVGRATASPNGYQAIMKHFGVEE